MKKELKDFWQICVLGNLRYIKHSICEGPLRSADNNILKVAAYIRSDSKFPYVGNRDHRSIFWTSPENADEYMEWVGRGIIAK